MGVLDMLLHLADENAREFKERDRSRTHAPKVTLALLERQEWAAFVARLKRRRTLLHLDDAEAQLGPQPGDDEAIALDVDEDDIDMLLSVVVVLDRATAPMTLSEIVREMQQAKVLSLEFIASAREQTKRLLTKLRELHRAWSDDQGRWSLL